MKGEFIALLAASANSLATFAGRIYSVDEGATVLNSYIGAIESMQSNATAHRSSYKLEIPHKNTRIADKNLKKWLPRALISICSQPQVDAGDCVCKKYKQVDVFSDRAMDSQAAVAVRSKRVIVSYRPTVSEKNWETNADSTLISYPSLDKRIKVHRGHLRHFKSTQSKTEAAVLRHLNNSNRTLYITGFSLGGSVAAISAPMWHNLLKTNNLKNKIKLIIYSNPRPGNLHFSNHLNSLNIPITRYARSGDVVPQLPPQEAGYAQVGKEYYQSKSLPIKRCSTNYAEDPNCGLKADSFDKLAHFLPFENTLPTPLFC